LLSGLVYFLFEFEQEQVHVLEFVRSI